MLLLYSGLRRSEATALTWADIDLDDATITVSKGYDFRAKRSRSPRPLPASAQNGRPQPLRWPPGQSLPETQRGAPSLLPEHPDKPFHRIKRQAQYTRCRALDQQRGYNEEREQREQQRTAAERQPLP